jgi:transketolase
MISDAILANAIRVLSQDAMQRANPGQPGLPMGMTEAAVALWHRHLKHNPLDPHWPDRDRFILDSGHGAMLLYSLLHLCGYALPMEELKRFRRLHSKTPGHPEVGYTPGVEATTGPLGQGLANAVGMALAEKLLASEFNRDGLKIVDHRTYVFIDEGCLMEGISHETCSLAGAWGLAKLIAFYDDSDGGDMPARFAACGWNVLRNVDGRCVDTVDAAIRAAQEESRRPTLICCKTECAPADRAALGWRHEAFVMPDEVLAAWDARKAGGQRQGRWELLMKRYRAKHPKLAAEYERRLRGELPQHFSARIAQQVQQTQAKAQAMATCDAGRNAAASMAAMLPELTGGAAESGAHAQGGDRLHNDMRYGAREFGMAAIMNGLALHGGLRPFGIARLMSSDYARNALRMAALMRLNPVYAFTHDSIGADEDGPAHQAVEQTATMRLIPNMDVWRPCDAVETLVAWQMALEHRHTPTCLILCRQSLPCQSRDAQQVADIRRGGYTLRREGKRLQAVLIATGSEVALAVQAQALLAERNVHVRVVSMPSPHAFDRQDLSYQHALLPLQVPLIAIEAGVCAYWRKYVGRRGAVIGIDTFGESAPAEDLYRHFGLTAARIVETTLRLLPQPAPVPRTSSEEPA